MTCSPGAATRSPNCWRSQGALADARDAGGLAINPIIYAEVSAGFDTLEELDDALPARDFVREPLPYQAGFVACRAFVAYRRRGGERRSPWVRRT